jgi:alanine racemase
VTRVQRLAAGARPSYGRRRALPKAATVVVVPVGYADGVPRAAFEAGLPVLVGGRPRPLAGMVTMDQLLLDCGDDPVQVGDEAVLLGRQGKASLTAWDWARTLGTIAYEVLCHIGPRVPRVAVGEEGRGWAASEEEVARCQGRPGALEDG